MKSHEMIREEMRLITANEMKFDFLVDLIKHWSFKEKFKLIFSIW